MPAFESRRVRTQPLSVTVVSAGARPARISAHVSAIATSGSSLQPPTACGITSNRALHWNVSQARNGPQRECVLLCRRIDVARYPRQIDGVDLGRVHALAGVREIDLLPHEDVEEVGVDVAVQLELAQDPQRFRQGLSLLV